MRTADLVTGSVLVLLGGIVLWDAVRLGIGWGVDGPRSGFFPFWLALIMIGTCGAIIVQAVRRRSRTPFVSPEQARRVLTVLVPAALLVLATDPPGYGVPGLGLYVAAALYIAVYMRWIGRHGWGPVVVVATVIPALAFVIFEMWFLVPMPKGPLEAWLGY